LGVIFDDKLCWKPHIEMITTKTQRLFGMALSCSRQRWGINPNILYKLYHAIFLPCLLFGSIAWHHEVCAKKTRYRKLRSAQRLLLLKISGCYCYCSFDKLCLITGIVPIEMVAAAFGRITAQRINKNVDLDRRPNSDLYIHPGLVKPITFADYDNSFQSGDFDFYTDGSKMVENNYVAAGVVLSQDQANTFTHRGGRLGISCSIFQAELLAIKIALDWAETLPISRITISSDSKSALQLLSRINPISQTHLQIQNHFLSLLQAGKIIDFYWCHSHSGIRGNEEADKIARQQQTADIIFNLPPLSSLKRTARMDKDQQWIRNAPNVQGSLAIIFLPLQRRFHLGPHAGFFKHINHFISGHGPFLDKIYSIPNKICSCNLQQIHNAEHVLQHCLYGVPIRDRIIRLIKLPINRIDQWIQKQMICKNYGVLKRLNQFLHLLEQKCRPINNPIIPLIP
jgi:ribonuclease HI